MTRPGFRKGRPGGARQPAVDSDGFLSSSLFSQAQILHLMKNEFARARRHGIPMGIVLLQVDRIKVVIIEIVYNIQILVVLHLMILEELQTLNVFIDHIMIRIITGIH